MTYSPPIARNIPERHILYIRGPVLSRNNFSYKCNYFIIVFCLEVYISREYMVYIYVIVERMGDEKKYALVCL